ncbi:hypothetical protein MKW94_022004 [Papaver nudicaule]|uniref:RRM domain-containing protein n=1 Tax=Papaver nudicaule TaxID=74823 RepID=A0AA41VB92_PAPNU|nr:hypothetical protein [Papaver nudicaule]
MEKPLIGGIQSESDWKNNFGFCCELDNGCARELEGVPGVKSVHSDKNFGSENKDYRDKSTEAPQVTKCFFWIFSGKSYSQPLLYASEKTLRAAFESFGDVVEVKIIMDRISKRSRSYAFTEYTTEEAAGAALKEMNGKILKPQTLDLLNSPHNGDQRSHWIVVMEKPLQGRRNSI